MQFGLHFSVNTVPSHFYLKPLWFVAMVVSESFFHQLTFFTANRCISLFEAQIFSLGHFSCIFLVWYCFLFCCFMDQKSREDVYFWWLDELMNVWLCGFKVSFSLVHFLLASFCLTICLFQVFFVFNFAFLVNW